MSANILRFLSPDHPELERAWQALDSDPCRCCECCGEVWQYMGTVKRVGDPWVHEFRHRHHPDTGKREYRKIPVRYNACPRGFETWPHRNPDPFPSWEAVEAASEHTADEVADYEDYFTRT